MRKNLGFTIIELLAGIALTLTILAFVTPMTISFFNINNHYNRKSQRILVLDKIARQIRQDFRLSKKILFFSSLEEGFVLQAMDKNNLPYYITYSAGKDRPNEFYRSTFVANKKRIFSRLTGHLAKFQIRKNNRLVTLKITLSLPQNQKSITREIAVFMRTSFEKNLEDKNK